MRTTITIDDALLARAKARAAAEQTSVSRLVERALRLALDEDEVAAPPFELVTVRGCGTPPTPERVKQELLAADAERFRP